MAAIITLGQLETLQRNWTPGVIQTGTRLSLHYFYDYAALYRLQPNVRTCVDFLARNVAQLGLHTYRRVSETDRERLRDHGLAQLMGRPLPARAKVTRYRLIEALMSDLGIYHNAYWLKLRDGANGPLTGLLRVPPPFVTIQGGLVPTRYDVTIAGSQPLEISPDDIVHFRGFNPENMLAGLSPLETLRRVLAEEHEAGEYREQFWRNAARQSGVIKRPLGAPEWSAAARAQFKAEFEELYSGAKNSGKTAILEEGMEWESTAFNAQESEYLAGRKLTREECARAYHIPLPMVGILDHATFSNIKEQHKHLYQDALGPWLTMIVQDIELQLLPEFEDTAGVYVEFNIQEKLRGSFEEQTQSLQSAVGRPWMTANEARARQNLPSIEGGDELVTPLNVLVGGQASPRDSAPPKAKTLMLPAGSKLINTHMPELRSRHEAKWVEVLARHYRRQEAAIVSRIPKGRKVDIGGVWYDEERWNSELSSDLLGLNLLTAKTWADQLATALDTEVNEDGMMAWLEEHSRIQAENVNAYTRDQLEEALTQPDALTAVRNLFVAAVSAWAIRQAIAAVLAASNFGANEGARAGGMRQKTWVVNSTRPRPEHSAMNGETVDIDSRFSNGMRWPGDPAGGAENNANCQCSVIFSR